MGRDEVEEVLTILINRCSHYGYTSKDRPFVINVGRKLIKILSEESYLNFNRK